MTTIHLDRAPFATALSALALAAALGALVVGCSSPATAPSPVTPSKDGPTTQPAPVASVHDEPEHGAGAKDREQVDPDGVVRRGAPLSLAIDTVPVSIAVAKAKELDGKRVKLQGKVESVCAKMGCWFVVQGEKADDKIRITTKAHNIFVPRSAVGMTALVEGTLTVKTLDKATAQHFEDERELKEGETRKTITGDVTELAIDVTGLEMKKS